MQRKQHCLALVMGRTHIQIQIRAQFRDKNNFCLLLWWSLHNPSVCFCLQLLDYFLHSSVNSSPINIRLQDFKAKAARKEILPYSSIWFGIWCTVFLKLKKKKSNKLTNRHIGWGLATPYPQCNPTRLIKQKNLHSVMFFLTWRFESCFYLASGKAVLV